MLVDLIVEGRKALIVGGGKEAEFKALRLLEGKAMTTAVAESFTPELRRLASKSRGRLRLVEAEATADRVRKAVEEVEPAVVFISTGDSTRDEILAATSRGRRRASPLVCVVDDPRLNDFNMPALARLGDITVGVSTGGKSPAMAGILRSKLAKAISPEDVLQVRLQGRIRKASRERLKDPVSRKEFAYKVIRDRRVTSLLKRNEYAAAERLAEKMLGEASANA